ncbi:LuxR family transcriptional regulator [Actinomycetospora corticicola]|uniref:DNA-binding CsgD family transcriptional regulator n=1 Tax=Actinomycetospora corticicola TaxID=663602 RepID=A0A7Y9DXB6_9PSEU|nr:DNA-binding CsgD family transcriptional regulator [Actinomycetospora corticicola]
MELREGGGVAREIGPRALATAPAGAAPPVLGRAAELAWITGFSRRALAGRAGRALVLGPGGIGKTVLVEAAVALVPDAVVVRVHAVPAAPPGALLGDLLAALGAPCTRALGADEAAAVLLAILGEQQDRGPVVVVVHDVHDADEPSSRAIERVFRRLVHDRVLLLATARPEGLGQHWSRFFADGPDAGTLSLEGLDEDGVRDLVAALRPGRWSRSVIALLHRDTGGHPLHLTRLLRELPDEVLLGGSPLPAPRELAQEVTDAASRLSDGARRLLACLAVLDRPAHRTVLARVDALADVALEDAARELVEAGLVDAPSLGDADRLRIHHPLVRNAVEAALEDKERARLHLDAARAVGGAAALMHRVAAARGRPDPELADELESAAVADPGDVRAATARLLAAADLSATGDEAARRTLAAGLLLVDGQDAQRLSALAPSIREAEPSPGRDVVLGFLASQGQDPHAALLLQSALDAPDGDPETRALAGVRLALEHVFRGRGAAATEAAARVPVLTRRPLRAEQAHILEAVGRAQHAGPDAGLERLDGHVDGALGADPAITAGTLLLAAGRVPEARRRLEEGLSRVRRGAASTSTHRAHCHLVEVLYRSGRWDLAEAEADVALDWFADGDLPWAESVAHAVAAMVPAARCQQERATAHLAAARASLARTFNPQGVHAIALAEAILARALGDGAGMERALRDVPAVAARGGMSSAPFAPWRPLHAEALVATGDLVGARRAVRSWPRAGAPLWFRLARHQVQARIALGGGDPVGAAAALRSGIALADAHGAEADDVCPVELAELRALLAGLPDVHDADEQNAVARLVFERLAATPWLDSLRAGDPAPSHDDGARGLTPRERQVAGLVARGMTSREAAEVLWVTPKAVDYHLGNVYAKLGLTSRRQLRGRSFS